MIFVSIYVTAAEKPFLKMGEKNLKILCGGERAGCELQNREKNQAVRLSLAPAGEQILL